jgi:hypothetical protein
MPTAVVYLLSLGYLLLGPFFIVLPLTLISNKKREKIDGYKHPVSFGRIIGNTVIFLVGFFLIGILTGFLVGILQDLYFKSINAYIVTLIDVIVRTLIIILLMYGREINRKIKVKETSNP